MAENDHSLESPHEIQSVPSHPIEQQTKLLEAVVNLQRCTTLLLERIRLQEKAINDQDVRIVRIETILKKKGLKL